MQYRRIATEEAWAIPEQFDAWRELLKKSTDYDPDLFLARAQTDGGLLSRRLLDADDERLRIMTNSPLASFATYSDPASGIEFKPVTAIQQHTYSAKADWHGSEAFRVELIGSYSDFESQFATDADGSPLGEQTVDGRQSFHGRIPGVRGTRSACSPSVS